MPCYIISYDLIEGKNYEELYRAIESYGTWKKITESTWAIVTEDSAVEIRDNLSRYTDSDDRIFVIKSSAVAAWINVLCENEWLRNNL